MQKCNYCGFVSKYNVDLCPHCGSMDYTMVDNFTEYEVKSKPKGGYNCIPKPPKVDKLLLCILLAISFFIYMECDDFFKYRIISTKEVIPFIIVECIVLIIVFFLILKFDKVVARAKSTKRHRINSDWIVVWFFIINPLVMALLGAFAPRVLSAFFYIAIIFVVNAIVMIVFSKLVTNIHACIVGKKNYDSLVKNGILIKNIKYDLIEDENNSDLKKIKVKYITREGVQLNLISQQSYYVLPEDNDVDILLDKTNMNNYYIDFEIV